jgi:MerR family mercuric resistance operon transcriptional regulator
MLIGEVAKKTGLGLATIRYYEKRGLLVPPERRPGGYREYSETHLDALRFIGQAQGLGLSLAEIRELLDLRARPVEACRPVRDLLAEKLRQVRTKITDLHALESELQAALNQCNRQIRRRRRRGSVTPCPVLQRAERATPRGTS